MFLLVMVDLRFVYTIGIFLGNFLVTSKERGARDCLDRASLMKVLKLGFEMPCV